MRNTLEEAEERKKLEEGDDESKSIGPIFDSFVPFFYVQYKEKEIKEFTLFNDSVDEYFSKIESQKINVQKNAQASVVSTKLVKVKKDQSNRIKALESKEEECTRKALLIQDNVDDVEKAILIIRSAIANSMDWSELGRIIKEEKKNGDRIAEIIYQLKLETNHVTLLLSNIPYDADEEELTGEPEIVEIDISLSAHANIQRYYDMKKNASSKKEKTEAAVSQALKAAQKKAEREIKQVKVKTGIQKVRKQLWFEKFYWFISSDNYIVISGRDAQQNELIVKRYMQKGDLYVHADIHGASTCVIKNNSGNVVPPTTLEQAGQMAICRSAAWKAKVVTSAYWVYHHQVSKTAPTGEYLTTGSFMIRGKKNFLPPAQLVMGFGLLFRVDESCVSRHVGERKSKFAIEDTTPNTKKQPMTSKEDADDNEQFQKLNADTFEKKDTETTTNDDPKNDKIEETDKKEQVEDVEDKNDNEENDEEEDEEQDDDDEEDGDNEKVDEKDIKESFQPAHLGVPDKYRIDYSDMIEEEEEDDDIDRKPVSRPRISKKERKLLKKGVDPNTVPQNTQPKKQEQKSKPKVNWII